MRVLKYVLVSLLFLALVVGIVVFLFTRSLQPEIVPLNETSVEITATRIGDGPIVTTAMHPMLIEEAKEFKYQNINGPSLIKVPEWVENPMGKYYLYFAHHKGSYIRLAYADTLTGPWIIADQRILPLEQSGLATKAGDVSGINTLRKYTSLSETLALIQVAADYKKDYESRKKEKLAATKPTAPHLASPEVFIDHNKKRIRLYYHGVVDGSLQMTKVAQSHDGLTFIPEEGIIGLPYFRSFEYRDQYYGLAMPGFLYRSQDGLKDFEVRNRWVFSPQSRHYGLHLDDSNLYIFYSKVGDAPEVIYYTKMDLSPDDWNDWVIEEPRELLRPAMEWEGVNLPVVPSMRGESGIPVNEVRDPDIFKDPSDGELYMLYTGQGEQNIGIAKITINK